jgi:hypothetical protein
LIHSIAKLQAADQGFTSTVLRKPLIELATRPAWTE